MRVLAVARNWAREALLAPLEQGSTIIVVSSGVAEASPLAAGYIATKAGQVALVKCLALEAQAIGIRVHYLLPNLIPETDMGRRTVDIFAQRFGVSEQTILEQFNAKLVLTPKQVGEGFCVS